MGKFTKGPNMRGRKKNPIKTTSTVIRSLLEITVEQETSYRSIAKKGGFAANGPTRWRVGLGTPSVLTAECWAEALGVSLEVLTKEEKQWLESRREHQTIITPTDGLTNLTKHN
jgi:hypothetical protein